MALTNETPMPTDEELTVPQEITLSTPWLKAVAPHMHKACETECKEFMLLRSETEDPRKVLKEGKKVTACGVEFLKKVKRSCNDELAKYADCIDRSHKQFLSQCIEEKLNIVRPELGYFSKVHAHESEKPKRVVEARDYKAEAAKVMSELPADYHIRDDFKRYDQFKHTFGIQK